MQINQLIKCGTFPCADVNHASYTLPGIEINPEDVSVILISESAPADSADYYYAPGNPSCLQAGPSYFIEQSKRRMIASDIAAALRLARS